MERNYKILEIRGFSGTYLRQKDGSFYYKGKLYRDKSSGVRAGYYLDSDKKHYAHSIARDSDGLVITVGDRTTSGIIEKINIRDGVISFYHGKNSGPNLYLDEIEPVNESHRIVFADMTDYPNVKFTEFPESKKELLLLI